MANFDINPHVIRQLGKELVSDSITALLELIKNSYDADATYVNVDIDTTAQIKGEDGSITTGSITIEDDGFGMDEKTILKSWLIISYSNKRPNTDGIKKKTPKGRTPLGDKGLGRLSTQKLADTCEIYSKKENALPVHVYFDWREFDKAETLSKVKVEFDNIDFCASKKQGTKIVLHNITDSDSWQGENLERFKGMLSQLISPFENNRPFNVFLTINGENINLVGEYQKIKELTISDIDFNYKNREVSILVSIDIRKLIGQTYDEYVKYIIPDQGKHFLEYFLRQKKASSFLRGGKWLLYKQCFKLDELKAVSLFEDVAADPGDFEGKIMEYSFNSKGYEKWSDIYKNFTEYKTFIQNQIGVKIFRNGFAVRPYGLTDKDWLSMGSAQTSGSSYYGLRPGNVVGYVAIDEGINRNLKDKTDREGLIDNEYSRNFMIICGEVVNRVNECFEILRRSYNDYKKSLSQENTKIQTLTDAYKLIESTGTTSARIAQEYKSVVKNITNVQRHLETVLSGKNENLFQQDPAVMSVVEEVSKLLQDSKDILTKAQDVLTESQGLNEALVLIKPKIETLQEQLDTFSELASLGLVSEMVSHDLGGITRRLLNKNIELEKILKNNSEITRETLYSTISLIKSIATAIQSQIKHLDSSMKYQREQTEVFSVSEVIRNDELNYYNSKFEQQDIRPSIEIVKDFDIQMNKGKFIQIFDNLINNSIYWLQDIDSPSITVTVDKPWIYFEDNGHGIDPTVETTLFEPFVTRKPRTKGRGLGLFIIRQLLDTYGCEIILSDERNNEGRLYKFAILFSSIIK